MTATPSKATRRVLTDLDVNRSPQPSLASPRRLSKLSSHSLKPATTADKLGIHVDSPRRSPKHTLDKGDVQSYKRLKTSETSETSLDLLAAPSDLVLDVLPDVMGEWSVSAMDSSARQDDVVTLLDASVVRSGGGELRAPAIVLSRQDIRQVCTVKIEASH